jgi:hypothetical protein
MARILPAPWNQLSPKYGIPVSHKRWPLVSLAVCTPNEPLAVVKPHQHGSNLLAQPRSREFAKVRCRDAGESTASASSRNSFKAPHIIFIADLLHRR